MKTTTIELDHTIELDQFRNRLDQALAEVEQGEVIVTRRGKPWIVIRAASHDQDAEAPSEVEGRGESASDSPSAPEESDTPIGKTVAWVRQYLGRTCTIPPEAMAFVDGKQVPEDHVLTEGRVLEFALEPEDEEWAAEMYKSPEFWEMIRQRRSEEAIPWDEAMRQLGLD